MPLSPNRYAGGRESSTRFAATPFPLGQALIFRVDAAADVSHALFVVEVVDRQHAAVFEKHGRRIPQVAVEAVAAYDDLVAHVQVSPSSSLRQARIP